jgi:tRNA(Ile)-lysidine synthetase-like protein
VNHFEAELLGRLRARGDGVEHTRVLVACSGGGDSTALLAFLAAVRASLDLDLVAAHVDHGLREESGEDARAVRNFCRVLDLDLVEARLDVQAHARREGLGLETAARDLRWAWLRAEAASCGATAVATGHTLDDHTETILVRMARGGGAACLTPLPVRQGLRWSPFVQTPREALRAYLRTRSLTWREDPTNARPITPRNRFRAILASLRTVGPALDRHLWETHLQVEELLRLRDRTVEAWRGGRWDLGPGLLLAREAWGEDELRWVLDRAFRDLGWPREAEGLRGLAHWLVPRLARAPRKPARWGGWTLAPAAPSFKFSWICQPPSEPGAP